MAAQRDDTASRASAYPEPSASERRVDPDDEVAYSFDEFRRANRAHYEDSEIVAYWFDSMTAELPEGAKLFVDGLGAQVSEAELGDALAPCGEVAYCEIFRDPLTQKSKGFASVQFATVQAASEALRKMNGAELCQGRLTVCPLNDHRRNVSVFAGALPAGTTASDVESAFALCGHVARCTLLRVEGRSRLRGQARIDFVFPESVERAVQQFHLRESAFNGSKIVVCEWQEDEEGRRVPGPSVFLAKLDPATSHEEVWQLLEGIGIVVVDVLLFRNKDSSEPHAIGKAELSDQASCKAASEKLHGTRFRGADLLVRELGSALPAALGGGQEPTAPRTGGFSPAVFVSCLSPHTTVERLRAHFARVGGMGYCKLFLHDDGTPRSAAKVEFATEAQQARAIEELQGVPLDGYPLSLRPFSANLRGAPAARGAAAGGPRGDGRAEPAAGGAGGGGPVGKTAVHVYGLHAEATAPSITRHFAACGRILTVHVMLDRETGLPRGNAKVVFAREEGARAAVETMNGSELDGRSIFVREFVSNRFGGGPGPEAAEAGERQGKEDNAVYVTGLGPETGLDALIAFLEPCGQILDAHMSTDRFSGKPKGAAKVTFVDAESAQAALSEMHGRTLHGDFLSIRRFAPSGAPLADTCPDLAVFVSCLYPETTSETLKAHFESCGKVLQASTGKSIGFGKVIYADRGSKSRALKELNGSWLEGRALVVSAFDPMRDRGLGSRIRSAAGSPMSSVLVVGLDPCTTGEEIKEHFEACGPVLHAQLLQDRESGQPKGLARVAFEDSAGKWRAVGELDGSRLRGRTLRVRELRDETSVPAEASRWAGSGGPTEHLELGQELGRPGSTARTAPAPGEGRGAAAAGQGARGGGSAGSRSGGQRPGGNGPRADAGFAAYVAGLGPGVDGATLARHFEDCGEIEECRIFFDASSGESKRSGKISFVTAGALVKALTEMHGSTLNGCSISVREFGRLAPRRSPAVFVMGLHRDTDNESLRRHFEEAGEVVSAWVLRNTFSASSRCVGKVAFASERAKDWAIRELDGSLLDGSTITVREFASGKGKGKGAERAGDRVEGAEQEAAQRAPAERGTGEELRKVDPDDGAAYTFDEFLAKHVGRYGESEVRAYWASECRAPAPPAPGTRTAVGEWLAAVGPGLLAYREAIEQSYDSLEQILSAHAATGNSGQRQLEAGFFEQVGIARIAHKRLINKWIGEMT